MRTYIKNDLKKTHLILAGEEGEKEDYQISMLRENEIPGILPADAHYLDNQLYYQYDISGKETLEMASKKANLKYDEIRTLVIELMDTIYNVQQYMLDGNCLLLEPEYIFCERGHYYFCYYPACRNEAKVAFHRLTEFFVREVNYDDKEGVYLAYTLHKATMEEHYSIEQIMEEFRPEEASLNEEVAESTTIECEQEETSEESPRLLEKLKEFWDKIKSRYLCEEEKYL